MVASTAVAWSPALSLPLVFLLGCSSSTPTTGAPGPEPGRLPGTECPASECGPAPGMPAQQCADGSVGGNTGRCLAQASGTCGWEIRECPAAGSAGACIKTGCSGTVCAEAGNDVMTTCEFRPEYACYRSAQCEPQADGKCGWTQTPELGACLANPPKE